MVPDSVVPPRPVPVPAAVLQAALPAWADVADAVDQLEMSLRLLEAADQPDVVEPTVARARLLVLLGRAPEAVDALALVHMTELPDGSPPTWPDCVLAAALAATGDQRAYGFLLWAASCLRGPALARLSYLVAAAAEEQGDHVTADRAWEDLRVGHGVATGLTVARSCVGIVIARDREDVPAAVKGVARAAGDLMGLLPPLAEHPEPALQAARWLTQRGDSAGARLLLTALMQNGLDSSAVSKALAALGPPAAMRRYMATTRGVSAISVAVLIVIGVLVPWSPALLLPVVLGLALGRRRLQRAATLPGMSPHDSEIWRCFSALRFDRRTGTAYATLERRVSGTDLLAALLGLVAGTIAATAVSTWLRHALGLSTAALLPPSVATVAFLACFVAPILASRRRLLGQARRRETRRELSSEAAQAIALTPCRCWRTDVLLGASAQTYQERHLVRVSDNATTLGLRHTFGQEVAVSRCPITGALWFGGPLGAGELPLLLSGPAQEQPVTGARQPDTGFYL